MNHARKSETTALLALQTRLTTLCGFPFPHHSQNVRAAYRKCTPRRTCKGVGFHFPIETFGAELVGGRLRRELCVRELVLNERVDVVEERAMKAPTISQPEVNA